MHLVGERAGAEQDEEESVLTRGVSRRHGDRHCARVHSPRCSAALLAQQQQQRQREQTGAAMQGLEQRQQPGG